MNKCKKERGCHGDHLSHLQAMAGAAERAFMASHKKTARVYTLDGPLGVRH